MGFAWKCVHSELGVTPSVVTSPAGYPSTGCSELVPVRESIHPPPLDSVLPYQVGQQRWQGTTTRGSRPESLKVSGLGLQLCSLQEWCWFVSTVLDLVEVEWQLDLSSVAMRLTGRLVLFVWVERQPDLSSVAARLRGRLVLFVQVKESRRIPVPSPVPVSTVVESGLHHQ
ncbi:hypothetical protein Taro_025859 [Colocasia esculenta]|uniref:Uncharacterized protein n=1 Tax=Colocasia esculenta TaxID=4460 RepID=A0A843VDF6_COLES|nr:hypothetical protein [Colocasia esculenta]